MFGFTPSTFPATFPAASVEGACSLWPLLSGTRRRVLLRCIVVAVLMA
jgi:hypothetical protein